MPDFQIVSSGNIEKRVQLFEKGLFSLIISAFTGHFSSWFIRWIKVVRYNPVTDSFVKEVLST